MGKAINNITNDRSAVIVAGFRTPFMLMGQDFKHIREEELSALTIKELLIRSAVKEEEVDELIVGNRGAGSVSLAQMIARQAGLPAEVSAYTVQKEDLSSLESLVSAVLKIQHGLIDIAVAGGVDNMSQSPFFFRSHKIKEMIAKQDWKEKARVLFSFRPSDIEWEGEGYFPLRAWSQDFDFIDLPVTYAEQEDFIAKSFQKVRKAHREGKSKEEIIPIFPPMDFELKDRDAVLFRSTLLSTKKKAMEEWESIVKDQRRALWADGALFFLIMSRAKAQALGLLPLVSVSAFAFSGGKRNKRALNPVHSAEKVLQKVGLSVKDIGLWEIGESFPALSLACVKKAFSLKRK